MDNKDLLDHIVAHFDERTAVMRSDIKELDTKWENFHERLIKVESTQGFIKITLNWALGIISSIGAFLIAKVLDFKV